VTAVAHAVEADGFRPSADAFGTTAGPVVACDTCGHGSLLEAPDGLDVAIAYEGSSDPVSEREEPGRLATARRDLAALERVLGGPPLPGDRLLDVGCWTGAYVAAAGERGWTATGIEPSSWAVGEARRRGLDVRQTMLGDDGFEGGTFRAIVVCDVLEHLLDPAKAVARLLHLLEPGGVLLATVPDAGSRTARALGRRWWAVLPMHVQYFNRTSLARLLTDEGFAIASMRTHPKAFSRRYYAERLGAFVPPAARAIAAVVERGRPDALVAPDLHDRLVVLARRPDEER
jgi:2-polyprenyl-3-methyl-5-hydroxy-6-metoxy-1,4-benzoquinol methylase